ncbi:hypothetical protein [Nostoc sp. ChiQUE01b]|uniref:hypothetical protein n=1 Tax=Nostoc sp. ChiQUE01b TaxID=3075376 RepID=UPI002AD55114|nr:hypothetical protein [Nostoc sp. ChiQUE01b]MDZ8263134.1 hypothetical protein [Nostoc sp. ChiQUE01b]
MLPNSNLLVPRMWDFCKRSNGYYARISDDEYRSISEQEIGQYQDVGHYLKYTKALYDWSETLAKPFNLPPQGNTDVRPYCNKLDMIQAIC